MTMQLSPLDLFERQINCLVAGDRDAQLALYSHRLVYEFPFAEDRPKTIVGKEQFIKIMRPLWDAARDAGITIIGCSGDAHVALDDPQLLFGELLMSLRLPGQKIRNILYVQKLRVADGLIVAGTEYFAPNQRSASVR